MHSRPQHTALLTNQVVLQSSAASINQQRARLHAQAAHSHLFLQLLLLQAAAQPPSPAAGLPRAKLRPATRLLRALCFAPLRAPRGVHTCATLPGLAYGS